MRPISGAVDPARSDFLELVTHPISWHLSAAAADRSHGKTDGLGSNNVKAVLRRTILGATAAIAAPIGAMPVFQFTHPDAELLVACAQFEELERAYEATDFSAEPGSAADAAADDERERIQKAQSDLMEVMAEARPVTREAMVARAKIYTLWDKELMKDDGPEYIGQILMQAIMRDLIA